MVPKPSALEGCAPSVALTGRFMVVPMKGFIGLLLRLHLKPNRIFFSGYVMASHVIFPILERALIEAKNRL